MGTEMGVVVLGNNNQAEAFPLWVGDLEGRVECPARKVWGHQGHLWKCISLGTNGKEKPILVLTGKEILFIGTVSRDNLRKMWRRFRKMNEGWQSTNWHINIPVTRGLKQ